jgi:phenylacetate 2-hydroxylase
MDAKAYEGSYWLSYQWHQLKEQEHARPVLTAVVVVLLTYLLYTVSCACDQTGGIAIASFLSMFLG